MEQVFNTTELVANIIAYACDLQVVTDRAWKPKDDQKAGIIDLMLVNRLWFQETVRLVYLASKFSTRLLDKMFKTFNDIEETMEAGIQVMLGLFGVPEGERQVLYDKLYTAMERKDDKLVKICVNWIMGRLGADAKGREAFAPFILRPLSGWVQRHKLYAQLIHRVEVPSSAWYKPGVNHPTRLDRGSGQEHVSSKGLRNQDVLTRLPCLREVVVTRSKISRQWVKLTATSVEHLTFRNSDAKSEVVQVSLPQTVRKFVNHCRNLTGLRIVSSGLRDWQYEVLDDTIKAVPNLKRLSIELFYSIMYRVPIEEFSDKISLSPKTTLALQSIFDKSFDKLQLINVRVFTDGRIPKTEAKNLDWENVALVTWYQPVQLQHFFPRLVNTKSVDFKFFARDTKLSSPATPLDLFLHFSNLTHFSVRIVGVAMEYGSMATIAMKSPGLRTFRLSSRFRKDPLNPSNLSYTGKLTFDQDIERFAQLVPHLKTFLLSGYGLVVSQVSYGHLQKYCRGLQHSLILPLSSVSSKREIERMKLKNALCFHDVTFPDWLKDD